MIERCPVCMIELTGGVHECPSTVEEYEIAETRVQFDKIVGDLRL